MGLLSSPSFSYGITRIQQGCVDINCKANDLASLIYPEVSDEWLTITADEPLLQISMANVIKKLKGIDANKAYGLFDPSIKIIKLFADCFAVLLVHIFNQSLKNVCQPSCFALLLFTILSGKFIL